MPEKKYETEEEKVAARRAYMIEYMKKWREKRRKEGNVYKPNDPNNGKPGRPRVYDDGLTPEERQRVRYFERQGREVPPKRPHTRYANDEERKESRRKQSKKYYWDNAEARREYVLKWREKNRKKYNQYYKDYYQQHKEEIKARKRERYRQKKAENE